MGMPRDYMTGDQRFAAQRPDVLTEDVSIAVSTTGTDSDFVVKLIDGYSGDFPAYDE